MATPKKIGYWFSEEKTHKLKFKDFIKYCRCNCDVEFIKLDLEKGLQEQGPFAGIIHKLNDLFLMAYQGDEKAQMQLTHFQDYMKVYPDTIIVDPVFTASRLLNRSECYKIIAESDLCKTDPDVFIPPFVEINSLSKEEAKKTLKNNKVFYPIVSKPLLAESHEMAVIFNDQGLKDVEPPYVAHMYVNHSAILYKLYIIGKDLYFVKRPSLRNYTEEDMNNTTLYFHTWDVSKQNLSQYMNEFDDSCMAPGQVLPKKEKFRKIADCIRKELEMDLLGIDIIMEDETGRYGIIDINAFPGYKGIPEFFKNLQDYLIQKVGITLSN